ncbi:hypothetical protein Ancab_023623 [Ancistrocladus abbreviatus]
MRNSNPKAGFHSQAQAIMVKKGSPTKSCNCSHMNVNMVATLVKSNQRRFLTLRFLKIQHFQATIDLLLKSMARMEMEIEKVQRECEYGDNYSDEQSKEVSHSSSSQDPTLATKIDLLLKSMARMEMEINKNKKTCIRTSMKVQLGCSCDTGK